MMSRLAFLAFVALILSAVPQVVNGASVFLSPGVGTVGAGSSIRVSILLNSPEQSANAVSGVVSFPADKMRVASISKSGSQVNVWIEEPSYSNAEGRVRFAGIILNPGYQGPAGKILDIDFRGVAAGTAVLGMPEVEVLANDGLGTNMGATSRGGQYSVTLPSTTPAPAVPQASAQTPPSIEIRSATHPDQTAWYNSRDLDLSWDLPADAAAVNFALSKSPEYQLDRREMGRLSRIRYDLEGTEGTMYFFLRLHRSEGWTEPARYVLNSDQTPPSVPKITSVGNPDQTDPSPKFIWSAEDETSGIARYEVKTQVGEWTPIQPDPAGIYALAPQPPGEGSVTVRAYDRAGNYAEGWAPFTIQGISAPEITEYPRVVSAGSLALRGSSLPDVSVHLALKKGGELLSVVTRADSAGRWQAEFGQKMSSGSWFLSAKAVDGRGAMSVETSAVTVNVRADWYETIASIAIVVAAAFLFLTLLLYRHLRRRRRRA